MPGVPGRRGMLKGRSVECDIVCQFGMNLAEARDRVAKRRCEPAQFLAGHGGEIGRAPARRYANLVGQSSCKRDESQKMLGDRNDPTAGIRLILKDALVEILPLFVEVLSGTRVPLLNRRWDERQCVELPMLVVHGAAGDSAEILESEPEPGTGVRPGGFVPRNQGPEKMLDFRIRPCIHGVNVVPGLEDDFAASGGILDGFEPGRGTASLIPPGIRETGELVGHYADVPFVAQGVGGFGPDIYCGRGQRRNAPGALMLVVRLWAFCPLGSDEDSSLVDRVKACFAKRMRNKSRHVEITSEVSYERANETRLGVPCWAYLEMRHRSDNTVNINNRI